MPPSGIWCVRSLQAFSSAKASTSTMRSEPAAAPRRALLDVLGARGHQQHVEHFRVFFRRADHFEIEADLVHGERDVLVGLHLDLGLEFALAQVARHLDDLGDRSVAADGDATVAAAPARFTARRMACDASGSTWSFR
jgi:hypothetical protein